MTPDRIGQPPEPERQSEGGAVILLDPAGTVLAYTAPVPVLLGVDDDSAAVAEAVSTAVAGLCTPEPGGGTLMVRGCTAVPGRLSDGGWTIALFRRDPDAAPPPPSERERLLREIIDNIDASLVVYDRDERYVLGNRRFHEIYPNHAPDEELVGRTFEQLVRDTLKAKIYAEEQAYTDPEAFVARRLAERRKSNGAAREARLFSGEWHLLRPRTTPSGMQVTLRVDITEQKRLQQELAETSERLRTVSEAKSRFLAGMSHELRTPLNAIIGFSDMMREQVFGPLGAPQYAEYADDIARSGEHLLALIGDILDLSKAEAGALSLHPEPIDLSHFLPEELRMFEPEARRRKVSVTWRAPAGLPPLTADARALRQMLINLASNALKFTTEGVIVVSADRDADGGIEIMVSDTGVGIPAEAMARIGEPFYQAHDHRWPVPAGTGLGLALVHQLMKLHGGSLTLDSREGAGTAATLRFPAAAVTG